MLQLVRLISKIKTIFLIWMCPRYKTHTLESTQIISLLKKLKNYSPHSLKISNYLQAILPLINNLNLRSLKMRLLLFYKYNLTIQIIQMMKKVAKQDSKLTSSTLNKRIQWWTLITSNIWACKSMKSRFLTNLKI